MRLYFAEIYFEEAGRRVFDIVLEDNTMIEDYDIFAEAGHDVGVMKKFIVTSDGNLDVDLKRVRQQPKINAIEIIEIKDVAVAGLFDKNKNSLLSAYPNPFHSSFTINVTNKQPESIKLFDSFGREIPQETIESSANEVSINLDNYPTGIYYVQLVDKHSTGTVRVVKE